MPISVRDVIATLDHWSLKTPGSSRASEARQAPSRVPDGDRVESSLVRMLTSHARPDLQRLSDYMWQAAIREPGRDISHRTRKLLMGRVATLADTSSDGVPYEQFYGRGKKPMARLAQKYVEKWRRHVVSRLTLKASAYQRNIQQLPPLTQGETPSIKWLSQVNLARLNEEVGTLDAGESAIYERITRGPVYFKHATDAAVRIVAEGRMIAPALGINPNGTTPRNQPFNHLSYVFGRFEMEAGPSRSRFGASTIQIPLDALLDDMSISLHDQNMPFQGDMQSAYEVDGKVLRRIVASSPQPTQWLQLYGDERDAPPFKVSFLNEIFTGKDVCRQAVGLALVRELRRIGVSSQDGKQFRERVYAHGVNASDSPYSYAHVLKRLFHVEIRVPIAIQLDDLPANALTIFNPTGAGSFNERGEVDPLGRATIAAWNGIKHGLKDAAVLNKFLTTLTPFLEANIARLHKPPAKAATYSADIVRLWHQRLCELSDALRSKDAAPVHAISANVAKLAQRAGNALKRQPEGSIFELNRVRGESTQFVEDSPTPRIEFIMEVARACIERQVKQTVIADCEALLAMLAAPPPDFAQRCDAITNRRERRLSNQRAREGTADLLAGAKAAAAAVKSYLLANAGAPTTRWLDVPLTAEP